jgi:hypothetical protein
MVEEVEGKSLLRRCGNRWDDIRKNLNGMEWDSVEEICLAEGRCMLVKPRAPQTRKISWLREKRLISQEGPWRMEVY